MLRGKSNRTSYTESVDTGGGGGRDFKLNYLSQPHQADI